MAADDQPRPASSAAASPTREAAALLLLARGGRLAAERYSELIEDAGSALAVLTRERLRAAEQTSLFADPERELEAELAGAEREVANWRAQGMQLVSILDPAYPPNLRAAHDRPPLLFIAGRLKPRDERAIAVVGSRAASRAGLRAAAEIAGHLAACGYSVISGLAAGIDTAAHTGALARGGRTLAVIGTGLSVCYPRANVILQRRIAAECAVVSQFLPPTPPTRESFPKRNAVISGLSLASVIVEASATSGARIEARCSLAQGRPVFLLEPLLTQQWAQDLAARPGVYVVSSPSEIADTVERLTSASALVA